MKCKDCTASTWCGKCTIYGERVRCITCYDKWGERGICREKREV